MRYRFDRRIEGPSLLAAEPVIVAELSVPPGLERVPAGWADGLFRALHALRPSMADARTAAMPPLPEAEPGAGPAALVARAAAVLQRWAGHPVTAFGGEGGTLHYGFRLAGPGVAAGQVAARLFFEAVRGPIGAEAQQVVRQYVDAWVSKPAGVAWIAAAERRGVPWREALSPEVFLDLGHGARQKRIWMNYTSETTFLGSALSTHKNRANEVFRAHGMPVPSQALVADEEGALRAAQAIGFPVVVKPSATDFGTAVHVDLRDEREVRAAFADARRHGNVVVEAVIPGDHHRLMVWRGRFLSARRQKPAHVVGDGARSVRALVDATNADRKARGWVPVPLDAEALRLLAREGLGPDAVPAAGREVRLRTQGNLSQGGSMDVVTDRVHPDNARLAVRAAAVLGIDLAGLDFVTPDVSRSWMDGFGAICEINATPGLILGEEDLVLADLVDGDGRIPTIAVLDPTGDEVERAARALAGHGPVCRATSGGVWLDDVRVAPGDAATAAGARVALGEPTARAAVLEIRSDDAARGGLGFDRCDVAVIGAARHPGVERLLRSVAGRVVASPDDL